jgi:hypothetical protein
MIHIAETLVNQPVKLPFVSVNNVAGLTTFNNSFLLKDGVSVPFTPQYVEIANGLYVATLTPTSTGNYTYFIEGQIQASFKVVNKLVQTFLQNLEDVAIGSWVWDKNSGVLTFVRQDGSTLAGFSVVDDSVTANRQRTT